MTLTITRWSYELELRGGVITGVLRMKEFMPAGGSPTFSTYGKVSLILLRYPDARDPISSLSRAGSSYALGKTPAEGMVSFWLM
jgi:hypothetical protein